jgi:cytoskeletal protein RodZ
MSQPRRRCDMAELTPEEKRKIYEEEKYRLEVQSRLKFEAQSQPKSKKKKFQGWVWFLASVGLLVFIYFISSFFSPYDNKPSKQATSSPASKSTATAKSTSTSTDDKSSEIAQFIQSRVNTGGYTGCVARSMGHQLVEVKLNFPAGTSRASVEANVSGVADQFAQVGRLASTIYYRGYSGEQKACEYKYDPYSASVKKVK